MIFRLHRNYDPETKERGTEALSLYLGCVNIDIRWRSAEDGITPYWNICVYRQRASFWWPVTLIDWTIYDGTHEGD